jgi:hypothetical protein
MKRVWGIICGSLLLCAAGGSAAAQSWDGAVAGATELSSDRSLAALFWSDAATCANAADAANDLAARQCKGIRAARKAQVSKSKYLVRADATALSVTPGKDKRAPLTLRGCLACAAPITVAGKPLFVVAGEGTPSLDGAKVVAPLLGTIDVPADAAWRKDVLPRLRTELVISGAAPAAWKSGSAAGYKVAVVGYRVVDPCDGSILMANPKSASVKPDKRYCTGKPVVEAPVKDPDQDQPKEPELPSKLSSNDIRTALEPARDAARKCFEAYGIAGTALFRITINNEGDVAGLRQKGDFTDTPTGACIEKAVKAVVFPKSRKLKTTIDYPFILR